MKAKPDIVKKAPKKKKVSKPPFVPYPNDCGSCHGLSNEQIEQCRDCGGTGEHQP